MKYFTLLLFALILSTTTSCGGDEEVEPAKTGNCMTAKIDGVDFTATTATAIAFETTIEWNGQTDQETQILTITGTIPNLTGITETIVLTFGCSQLTSDLDFVDTDQECGIGMSYTANNFSDPTSAVVVSVEEGNIQIQEVSETQIKGTFNFSGMDQNGEAHTITDGFFDTTIN